MKKLIFVFALVLVFGGFIGSVSAATLSQCVDSTQPNFVACGNGPIVPQQPGGRFLNAGQEDCPWWFPMTFGRACYTMRPAGVSYIPLR